MRARDAAEVAAALLVLEQVLEVAALVLPAYAHGRALLQDQRLRLCWQACDIASQGHNALEAETHAVGREGGRPRPGSADLRRQGGELAHHQPEAQHDVRVVASAEANLRAVLDVRLRLRDQGAVQQQRVLRQMPQHEPRLTRARRSPLRELEMIPGDARTQRLVRNELREQCRLQGAADSPWLARPEHDALLVRLQACHLHFARVDAVQ
mmetsp:Transcript_37972/g.98267  ORF Transcript_37972/g.98267 Transcript_37972/m.98267 type:complete len:210 (+) Transcript_37972:266-895(+)